MNDENVRREMEKKKHRRHRIGRKVDVSHMAFHYLVALCSQPQWLLCVPYFQQPNSVCAVPSISHSRVSHEQFLLALRFKWIEYTLSRRSFVRSFVTIPSVASYHIFYFYFSSRLPFCVQRVTERRVHSSFNGYEHDRAVSGAPSFSTPWCIAFVCESAWVWCEMPTKLYFPKRREKKTSRKHCFKCATTKVVTREIHSIHNNSMWTSKNLQCGGNMWRKKIERKKWKKTKILYEVWASERVKKPKEEEGAEQKNPQVSKVCDWVSGSLFSLIVVVFCRRSIATYLHDMWIHTPIYMLSSTAHSLHSTNIAFLPTILAYAVRARPSELVLVAEIRRISICSYTNADVKI